MKKLVSMLLVLAMLVTVFAGLAITASAADAALTVCTQAGADSEKTLAKSYTAEELKKLAETKADGYGYRVLQEGRAGCRRHRIRDPRHPPDRRRRLLRRR